MEREPQRGIFLNYISWRSRTVNSAPGPLAGRAGKRGEGQGGMTGGAAGLRPPAVRNEVQLMTLRKRLQRALGRKLMTFLSRALRLVLSQASLSAL
jgi:hypothetical protein